MKKIVATIDPILIQIQYLILTILLVTLVIAIVQIILKKFGIDASFAENMKHATVPFLVTAGISMFVARKLSDQKK